MNTKKSFDKVQHAFLIKKKTQQTRNRRKLYHHSKNHRESMQQTSLTMVGECSSKIRKKARTHWLLLFNIIVEILARTITPKKKRRNLLLSRIA
jgi:hypothetical protein